VDDAGHVIGTEGGWEDHTSWTCQTIGIPEGVARIEGAEERRLVVSLLTLAHGGLRIEFRTVVILAITAPGVPHRRRMVWARMPREARQPLPPTAHAAALQWR
jgi:hypothetical protein